MPELVIMTDDANPENYDTELVKRWSAGEMVKVEYENENIHVSAKMNGSVDMLVVDEDGETQEKYTFPDAEIVGMYDT